MKRFVLRRHEDATGVSGTGDVAWGCEFPNGRVALTWNTPVSSCAWYDSITDVQAIHGPAIDELAYAVIARLPGLATSVATPERTDRPAPPDRRDRESLWIEEPGNGLSRAWRCPCGAEGRGGSGLTRHLSVCDLDVIDLPTEHERDNEAHAAAALTADEAAPITEALARPPEPPARTTDAGHRLDREGTSVEGYRAYCTCGWVTLPQTEGGHLDQRAAARMALHAHIEEIDAALHELDITRGSQR